MSFVPRPPQLVPLYSGSSPALTKVLHIRDDHSTPQPNASRVAEVHKAERVAPRENFASPPMTER